MTTHAVLIISADERERDALAQMLHGSQHLVVTARDLLEAVEHMQAVSPDVLVIALGDESRLLRGELAEHGCDWAELIPIVRIVDRPRHPASVVIGELTLTRPVRAEALVAAISRSLAWTALRNPRRTRIAGPPRILHIDAEAFHREMVRSSLARLGQSVVTLEGAATIAEARRLIEGSRFDCLVLDDALPDGSSVELLLQLEPFLINAALVGLVSHRDPHRTIAMLRAGCIDVLHKHEVFREGVLEKQLRRVLAKYHRRRAAAVLASPTSAGPASECPAAQYVDQLTGLGSSLLLVSTQARLHEECFARNTPYSVCAVNIDAFSAYNARFGRAAGDALICMVAETLREAIRDTDVAGRLSGGRFRVLLPGADETITHRVAHRIRQLLSKRNFPNASSHAGDSHVTVTIGEASINAAAWEDCASLAQRAENDAELKRQQRQQNAEATSHEQVQRRAA